VLATVIIPTHNYGRFLEEAVASVLAQGVDDLEVVVVDDGSTDETPAILARLDDPRVRSVRIEGGGASGARNTGLDLARGRYIAFLDADDRWRPGKLARQLALLEAEPDIGFVFTNFSRFDDSGTFRATQFDLIPELARVRSRRSAAGDGVVMAEPHFPALVLASQFPTWVQTVLVRSSVLEGLRYDSRLRLSQDTPFMYRLYSRVREVAWLPEPLVEVRRHGNNSYTSILPKLAIEPVVTSLVLEDPRLTAEERGVLLRKLGRSWSGLGYHHFHSGQLGEAGRAYLRALRYPDRRFNAALHLLALPLNRWLRHPENQGWDQSTAGSGTPQAS
jgi:glycosyltransferase involved in cell wall biosynthesis